jgi:hypothetical protein
METPNLLVTPFTIPPVCAGREQRSGEREERNISAFSLKVAFWLPTRPSSPLCNIRLTVAFGLLCAGMMPGYPLHKTSRACLRLLPVERWDLASIFVITAVEEKTSGLTRCSRSEDLYEIFHSHQRPPGPDLSGLVRGIGNCPRGRGHLQTFWFAQRPGGAAWHPGKDTRPGPDPARPGEQRGRCTFGARATLLKRERGKR